MAGDANTALLEAIAAGPGSGASVPKLLARLGESDPRLALVGQILARRQAEREADEADPQPPEPGPPVPDDGKRRAVRDLRRLVEEMYRELNDLRGRNDRLAAALGACHLCWGEETACPECGGRGGPGFYPPDRPLFARVVAPAARRLRPGPPDPAPGPTVPSPNG